MSTVYAMTRSGIASKARPITWPRPMKVTAIRVKQVPATAHIGITQRLGSASGIAARYPNFTQQFEVDYLLGRCLQSRAACDFDAARAAYRRAIDSPVGGRTETAALAQWMTGETFFHQRRYDDTIAAYDRVVRLFDWPRWQALALLQDKPSVVHQAGEKHIDQLRANYAAAGVQGELVAFIDDMARRYAEADLVVCRAGAVTIAELSAGGMASILVPFPHAVDDHQTANAKFLSERGAAILIQQRDLSTQKLADLLRSLNREKLLDMAKKARALGKPDAARMVARRCMEIAR